MSDEGDKPRDDLMDVLRKLSLRAAADILEFKHRLNDLGDESDGTPLMGGEGSGISREPRPRPGELLYEAARMQLEIAGDLLSMGHKYTDFWLDRARRLGSAMRGKERQAPLHFSTQARAGEAAAEWKDIHVYNARHRDVALELRCGENPGGTFSVSPASIPQQTSCAVTVHYLAEGKLAPGKRHFELEIALEHLTIGRLALALEVLP